METFKEFGEFELTDMMRFTRMLNDFGIMPKAHSFDNLAHFIFGVMAQSLLDKDISDRIKKSTIC